MSEHLQVVTTLPGREEALRIGRLAVEARLAACAQVVGPITSVYHWQGEIETSEEYQCVLKTRRDLYPQLEAELRKAHPYEVPEILATPVVGGIASYLSWMDEELKSFEAE